MVSWSLYQHHSVVADNWKLFHVSHEVYFLFCIKYNLKLKQVSIDNNRTNKHKSIFFFGFRSLKRLYGCLIEHPDTNRMISVNNESENHLMNLIFSVTWLSESHKPIFYFKLKKIYTAIDYDINLRIYIV